MKLMIASDLHGSEYYVNLLAERMRQERPDRLLLLGDLLYHGPRNDLPRGYDTKKTAALLNALSPKPLCIRGNCDGEVDQMVLSFPVMADYAALMIDGHVLYATHGHVRGEDDPPPLQSGDVLLCGHTHVPACRRHGGFTYVNPGSVSIPKNGSPHGFIVLEDGVAVWKDLAGDAPAAFDRQRLW